MGKIKVTNCDDIEGLKVIEPTVFGDSRGYFCMETYNYNDFKEAGIDVEFRIGLQDKSISPAQRPVDVMVFFESKCMRRRLVWKYLSGLSFRKERKQRGK